MKTKWTCIPDNNFKKEMFAVGTVIRDMVTKTSGAEEGLNVALTIMATFAASMNDTNWRSMMRSVTTGIIGGDGPEAKMEQAVILFFTSLDKIRKLANAGKSQYISKCNMDTGEENEEPDFPIPERGGLASSGPDMLS